MTGIEGVQRFGSKRLKFGQCVGIIVGQHDNVYVDWEVFEEVLGVKYAGKFIRAIMPNHSKQCDLGNYFA